jgi:beta-N-acetylglucosaminidase
MKKRYIVGILVCTLVIGFSGITSIEVKADGTKLAGVLGTSTVALTEAVELNNSIKDEIAKIREDRRINQEQEAKVLADFVASSMSSRFINYDIRTKTSLTGEQLDVLLKGTGLEGLGSAYAKAEEQYSVSAIVLIGISSVESAWGNSNFALTRNNLFGYQAYDSNTGAARRFKTKEACILEVAKALSENYLVPTGDYYNGVTLKDVNIKYASDKDWNKKITYAMNLMVSSLK